MTLMTSNRPFCRALSLLCVCLVLLPALLSTPAAAASKKRILINLCRAQCVSSVNQIDLCADP